jgi:hypothetical protein
VALARTFALWSGLEESPKLMTAHDPALRARNLERARALCERSKAVTAARFGHALVEGLDGENAKLGAERSVARALSRARVGVRRGHARDLAALAVLVGAGAYAERASLGVGVAFYGLLAVAITLTVLGALLRQWTLRGLVTKAPSLTHAAREATRGQPAASTGGPA